MANERPGVTIEKERPHQAGSDATRQKLIRAATEAFTELGFQSAPTREIARRAGVNEVTLFRHFRTRADLMRAVITETLAAEAAFMQGYDFLDDDLRAAVSHYVEAYVGVVERRKELARMVIGEGHLLPKDLQETIKRLVAPMKQRLADWLYQAQQRGLVRADIEPMAAVEVLRDALQSAVLRWSAFGTVSCSRDVYLQTFIELFVRGIEARASVRQH